MAQCTLDSHALNERAHVETTVEVSYPLADGFPLGEGHGACSELGKRARQPTRRWGIASAQITRGPV